MLGLLPGQPGERTTRARPSRSRCSADTAERSRQRAAIPRPPRRRPQVSTRRTAREKERAAPSAIRTGSSPREPTGEYPLIFYRDPVSDDQRRARVRPDGAVTLTVTTFGKTAAGLYKTAICDRPGVQTRLHRDHL